MACWKTVQCQSKDFLTYSSYVAIDATIQTIFFSVFLITETVFSSDAPIPDTFLVLVIFDDSGSVLILVSDT